MGHGQPNIYKNATLEIREQVDPNQLIPAQRYVLKTDFQRIKALYYLFQQQGIDIFALSEGLFFWYQETGPIPLLPPIVEASVEKNGEIVLLINDGMHRIYTARQLGKRINIILVRNVPIEYPYYAYPLEKGWQDVVELEVLTEDFVKKYYRDKENYKALFRNFNELFPDIQKQRPKIKNGLYST
jgi:hypothetical protein